MEFTWIDISVQQLLHGVKMVNSKLNLTSSVFYTIDKNCHSSCSSLEKKVKAPASNKLNSWLSRCKIKLN